MLGGVGGTNLLSPSFDGELNLLAAVEAATPCSRGCNPMQQRLQHYNRGCSTMVEAATARARRVRLRAAARAALSALAAPLRVARLHLGVQWHGAVLCLLAAPCAAAMRRAPRPLALAPRHAGRRHTRRVDLVWA
eukprot:scaffold36001_cov63-Phaeocystis_antarctica.AAC.2